ncbi:hypothetical protein QYE76_047327 [Lolium multiflorum]|uniref:Uncharacterized protein n=1 Tax=Lolium multiflorum TaxID=4521 RepID=A0AAD8X037_LOLMU|nr:hypothetical protein QYE76_047327 [Lolium multiflorum]
MDSDDEEEQMFVSLLEEENAAAAEDEEHMMILASLAALYAERNSKRGVAALRRVAGRPRRGSNNDINVLQCSPVFAKLVEGHVPPVNYEVSGLHYNKGYYLADGIYPTWSIFAKTISSPKLPKEVWFAKKQEAARKDVERAFGILQQRFAVVRFPAITWSQDQMWEVMNCCVILHNMIIENERKYLVPEVELLQPYHRLGPLAQLDDQVTASWASFLAMRQEIRDSRVHQELQDDLVDHLWARKGAARTAAP